MAKRKSRGSSKAGRPRKSGERFPGGKLKPSGPNETVIERRKIGDASAGEHPLDFALGQAWINEAQHRAGMAYRATFNRSHAGLMGPQLALQRLPETDESEQLRVNWSALSDEQIVDIFDKVFCVEPAPEDKLEREAAAMLLWKRLNAALTGSEREEMFRVCVLGSWPFWMPKEGAGIALGARDSHKRSMLLGALGAVSRAARPPRKDIGRITPVPHRKPRVAVSEVPIRYETQHGEQITPTSERGVPFEAVILRKRA